MKPEFAKPELKRSQRPNTKKPATSKNLDLASIEEPAEGPTPGHGSANAAIVEASKTDKPQSASITQRASRKRRSSPLGEPLGEVTLTAAEKANMFAAPEEALTAQEMQDVVAALNPRKRRKSGKAPDKPKLDSEGRRPPTETEVKEWNEIIQSFRTVLGKKRASWLIYLQENPDRRTLFDRAKDMAETL